jgi:hypothetical protein
VQQELVAGLGPAGATCAHSQAQHRAAASRDSHRNGSIPRKEGGQRGLHSQTRRARTRDSWGQAWSQLRSQLASRRLLGGQGGVVQVARAAMIFPVLPCNLLAESRLCTPLISVRSDVQLVPGPYIQRPEKPCAARLFCFYRTPHVRVTAIPDGADL